jgi:glycosyltransferase involved in cell wall biosynthesis
MRVLLNAIPLATGGGRTVGLNLVRSLPPLRSDYDFLALVPEGQDYRGACEEAGIESQVFARRPGYAFWRIWFDQVGVQRLAQGWGADVLFTLGNLGPIWPRLPHVLLFQNAYYIYPWSEVRPFLSCSEALAVRLQRLLFGLSLRRVSAVAAQTGVAAARLREVFDVTRTHVAVLPNAIDMGVESTAKADDSKLAGLRDRAGGRLVALTLARYYPHKNLELVIRTARRLREYGDDRLVFYITVDERQHPGAARLVKEIERDQLEDWVVNLGPILADGLPLVYQAADILFFPTLLESFSGTYLEAMHHRLPIVTSDRDFARECCGDAALYLDPHDVEAAVSALQCLAGNPELRERLGAAGRVRLKAMARRWSEIAEQAATLLDRAAAGRLGRSARPRGLREVPR